MADKKPTHTAVHHIQYQGGTEKQKTTIEIKPGEQFVASDVGDAAEIKRLEGLGSIKKVSKADLEPDAGAGAAGTGSAGTSGKQS